jgi:hypothetical protein
MAKGKKRSLDVYHFYVVYKVAKGRFCPCFSGSGVIGWPKGRKDPCISLKFISYTEMPGADFVLAFLELFEEH